MATDLLSLMRLGTKARYVVTLRGAEIAFRLLTVAEMVEITASAGEDLRKRPINAQNAVTEHTIFAIKVLERASTSGVDKNDPKLTGYILQSLTADELHFLFKEYMAGADKLNPSLEQLSSERLNELVALAKKNPSVLIELSFLELVNLCRFLVQS